MKVDIYNCENASCHKAFTVEAGLDPKCCSHCGSEHYEYSHDAVLTNHEPMHIKSFMYDLYLNQNGNIECSLLVHGTEHTFEITEKDAKAFNHLFQINSTGVLV